MTCEKNNCLFHTVLLIIICFLLLVVISLQDIWWKRKMCYGIWCKVNSVKEINIKNRTYYFFDDIINIRNLYQNKFKLDEKPYRYIFVYYIGYLMAKYLSYAKVKGINSLYHIINNINGYIEESKWNKYLTLLPTDER